MRKPLSQAEIEQRREAAKARWNKPGARRPKVTILVGPPGSGKTTWTRANAKDALVVSTDEYIDEYAKQHGLSYKQAFEKVNHSRLQEKALERFDMAIKEGWDVVVDRTNMKRSSRQRFLDRTPPHYEREAVVFDVPRDELFRRLRERKTQTGKEISPGIVNAMLAQYEKPDTSEFDRITPAGVGGTRRVRRMESVRRSTLRANPDTLFVFGDNLEGWGLGGQAKEMRGEPNAFGIPTKRSPRMTQDAFFTDADFDYFTKKVGPQFEVLRRHVQNGGSVVIPKDGIGTGLAQLPRKAPRIWKWLNTQFETLDKSDSPLAKREKGSPLSEAELKQRREAAKARWKWALREGRYQRAQAHGDALDATLEDKQRHQAHTAEYFTQTKDRIREARRSGDLVVYRGAPDVDPTPRKRDYHAVYGSQAEMVASNRAGYGRTSVYSISPDTILDADALTPREIAQLHLRHEGSLADRKQLPQKTRKLLAEELRNMRSGNGFLNSRIISKPTKEIADYVRSKGYDGWRSTFEDMVAVVNPEKLRFLGPGKPRRYFNVAASALLKKRSPGKPLSEAELKQRKDAANARWGNTVAGGVVGAALGGAVGAGYASYEHGQRRSLAFRYAKRERANKERKLKAVEVRQDQRLKSIDKYRGKATDSIGSVGSTRSGPDIDLNTASRKEITEAARKAGWPVPQYQRFQERNFALSTKGMSPAERDALREGTVIARGAKMDPDKIAEVFDRQGFDRVRTKPTQAGMYQIQGDVVRVNPKKGKPFAIELFGDEIEGIHEWNPSSMQRGRSMGSVRVGGLPSWEDAIAGARPPYQGLREGSTAVYSGAYKGKVRPKVSEIMETIIANDGKKISWTQKRREGKASALMRALPKEQRVAYFYAVKDAEDKGLNPPSLKQFMTDRMKGMKPPKRNKIDVKVSAKIGDTVERPRTNVRYQGTPNDEALDGMRRDMFDKLKQRFKTMSENAASARTKGRERVINRARSELKSIIQYGKFKPKSAVARAAPFVAGGALLGAGLGYLSGRKDSVEKLAKADTPRDPPDIGQGAGGGGFNRAELSLAAAIARTMRMWFEDPETADPEALMETTKPVIDAFNAGVSIQDKIMGDMAEGRQKILAFHFDARNPRVEQAARNHQLKLVGSLAETQMQAIQQALTDHTIRGGTPETTARAIRESIGLTPTQARHVVAYRLELETLHPGVLRRALRDKRFDSTVNKALEAKERIPQEKIDKMVDAYHRKYIAYRAMTIARTEVIRAANSGAVASTQAALDSMPDMTVVKTWVATNDARTRPDHKAMDGKSVLGMSTPFAMPDGSMVQFPHDPNAPAGQTINCRCTVTFKLIPRATAANQFMAETVH